MAGHAWSNLPRKSGDEHPTGPKEEEEDVPDPPRNFTASQLKYFDGTKDPKTGENKPVYLSLNGTVFDVSDGRDFYGAGGPYEMFAGRECGVALAKMSFDTSLLDDMDGCVKLNHGERMELENWIEKFTHYRCYPVLGKLIPDDKLPSSNRIVSKEELALFDGSGKAPEGYATPPIYIGAGDKIFDASFGGVAFYGKGCSYNRFAGKDASRALAKMSFDSADTENPSISDLSEKERKVLDDWVKTFEERKGYPCVGRLLK
jgi:membrane-associated progesterone receptor component